MADIWPLRNVASLNWSSVSWDLRAREDGAVQWGLAESTSWRDQRLGLNRACSALAVLPINPEKQLDSDSPKISS